MNPESVFARPARPPTRSSAARQRVTRRAGVVSVAVASLVATALPATASLPAGGPGVQAGHVITVFHNRDFVVLGGYPVGQSLTVEVLRSGVVIGTATGLASAAGGLEINHGPLFTPPAAGECWEGTTPDIRPKDQIKVTSASGALVEQVAVDGLHFTSGPVADVNDVLISGTAHLANGTAVPPADLTLALEFRDKLFRITPAQVVATVGVDGGFTARYDPTKNVLSKDAANPVSADVIRPLLLSDRLGHRMTLTAGAGVDVQIHDGLLDEPTAAPGCPAVAPDAVTATTPAVVNIAANTAATMNISGSALNANAVQVTVDDNDSATPAITAPATLLPSAAITGTTPVDPLTQSWTAAVPMAGVLGLRDGPLTVSAMFDRVVQGGVPPTVTRTITPIAGRFLVVTKDTAAPNAPEASPPAGTYTTPQSVSLTATGCLTHDVRYTLGSATGPGPTSISPIATGPILITASQTLRAVAIDNAGNVSPMLTADYVIQPPAPPAPPPPPPPPPAPVNEVQAPPPPPPPANQVAAQAPATGGFTAPATGGFAAPAPGGFTAPATGGIAAPQAQSLPQAAPLSPAAGTPITGSVPRAAAGRATAPGAPGMRSAAAGSRRDRVVSAGVTWTAPRSNGGRPITGYRVVATRSDGRSVSVKARAAARSLQVPGLTSGRTYTFRVFALNAVGASAGSARSRAVVAR